MRIQLIGPQLVKANCSLRATGECRAQSDFNPVVWERLPRDEKNVKGKHADRYRENPLNGRICNSLVLGLDSIAGPARWSSVAPFELAAVLWLLYFETSRCDGIDMVHRRTASGR